MDLTKFDRSYAEAKTKLLDMLNCKDPKRQEFVALAKYLLETTDNPYEYLPDEWAHCTADLIPFLSLLTNIEHAMLDDGEISFLVYSDGPKVAFALKQDMTYENLRDYLGRGEASDFFKNNSKISDVSFFKDATEFLTARVKWSMAELKRTYVEDTARYGEAFIRPHAGEHYLWTDKLRTEWAPDVLAVRERLQRRGMLPTLQKAHMNEAQFKRKQLELDLTEQEVEDQISVRAEELRDDEKDREND